MVRTVFISYVLCKGPIIKSPVHCIRPYFAFENCVVLGGILGHVEHWIFVWLSLQSRPKVIV